MKSEYLKYLQTRSLKAYYYRSIILYPRLKRYLPAPAIDVGCGIGDMLKKYPEMVGFDLDESIVNYCRELGYKAFLMNENNLPLISESQKSVLLDNVIEHIQDPSLLLFEVHRVLTVGGFFVVGVPGRLAYDRDPDHKVFYSMENLVKTITNAGFQYHKEFYSPFKSKFLDERLKFYTCYGVFIKIK
jgi:SAM-dependent methyltransferase